MSEDKVDEVPDPTPTSVEKSSPRRRPPRGRVVIFGMWCKGCRLCVEFCPTGVLVLEGDHPVVAHPEKCTACHWCDTHCPDLAISVELLNV